MAHIPAHGAHLLDNTGTEVGVILLRGQEDRFQSRLKLAVHQGHLKLELKVRNSSKSANDGENMVLTRKIDQESVEGDDLDVGMAREALAKHGDATFHTEHRGLRLTRRDSYDHGRKNLCRTSNNIDVPEMNGIEAAGVDCAILIHRLFR